MGARIVGRIWLWCCIRIALLALLHLAVADVAEGVLADLLAPLLCRRRRIECVGVLARGIRAAAVLRLLMLELVVFVLRMRPRPVIIHAVILPLLHHQIACVHGLQIVADVLEVAVEQIQDHQQHGLHLGGQRRLQNQVAPDVVQQQVDFSLVARAHDLAVERDL